MAEEPKVEAEPVAKATEAAPAAPVIDERPPLKPARVWPGPASPATVCVARLDMRAQ